MGLSYIILKGIQEVLQGILLAVSGAVAGYFAVVFMVSSLVVYFVFGWSLTSVVTLGIIGLLLSGLSTVLMRKAQRAF